MCVALAWAEDRVTRLMRSAYAPRDSHTDLQRMMSGDFLITVTPYNTFTESLFQLPGDVLHIRGEHLVEVVFQP